MLKQIRFATQKLGNLLFFLLLTIVGLSQAPQQPTNINPINGSVNYSNNTVTVTVTDPNGTPMTVKLYGRKKNCTSTAPKFTIIGLPDTQFYTEEVPGTNSGGGGSNEIFKAQTQWIAAHRLDSNIAFVTHLGDCVQNGDNPPGPDKQIEWKRADTAMKFIENPNVPTTDGIPYGICVGNHDESPKDDINGTTAFYNQYFGTARFTGRGYYGGRFGTSNNNNHYQLFSSGGIDFIHISIEFFPDGTSAKLQSILNWADSLLKVYPTRKGIISTHNLLGTGNPANFQGPGQKIYDDLKGNSNLFLMLAGHVPGEGRRYDTYNGNTVHSLMSDYQSGYTNGGNGFLRIMQFLPAQNLMSVKTFSPYANIARSLPAYPSSDFTLPVTFLCPFSLLGTNTNVPSGTSTTFSWPGLQLSTDYEWYVTISDGVNTTTSSIYAFNTWNGTPPPEGDWAVRFTDTTYISLGNAPELKLTDFTLEAWVKIEGYGSTTQTQDGAGGGLVNVVPIITKGRGDIDGSPSREINYFLGYEAGTNKLVADFEEANGTNHPVTSTAIIPMNTWTHVGASYDVASKTYRLFVGGAIEPFVLAASYVPQSASTVSTCIGSTLNTTSATKKGSFNGRIDEVRIWNIALTSLDPGELTSSAGLVGRWGLGEGAGAGVANSVAGGADGSIFNNYQWVTGFNDPDPTTNASIDFNGVHDYVTFGPAPSLNTSSTSPGFTLEGWIKVEGTGVTTSTGTTGGLATTIPIIAKGRADGDAIANMNVNYYLGINSTNFIQADFEESAGSASPGLNHSITATTAVPSNIWTHVAATYNISDGAWNLYANGVIVGTGNAGAGRIPEYTSIEHASIGSALNSVGAPGGFFNGKIDEVRIWNRALTQAEIQFNMNNQLTSGSGLLGRWGFNENGDTVVNNSVAGSANGILRSVNPYTHPTMGGAAWVSNGFVPTVTSTTTTTTTVSPNSIVYGTTTIGFTGKVTPNPFGGPVQFFVDGVAVGAAAVDPATGLATMIYNPSLLNAGTHTVRGDFDGNGGFAGNTGNTVSFTVTPATLTYVASGVSKVYGSPNPALTGMITGFQNDETMATATTGTLSFTTSATTTSNVGDYAITGSGLTVNNGNYTLVQAPGNSTSFIITDAVLTFTANPVSRVYGDPDPVFSGTVTGFVNGETLSTATTGTLTWSSLTNDSSNVGSYLIYGSGLMANNGNYSFFEAPSNNTALTITKRPLDFSGARFFANGNSTFLAAQLTPGNVVNYDVLSIGGTATVSSPNVGNYTSFVTNGLTTSNLNYQTTGGSVDVSILNVPPSNHKSIRFTDTSYVDLGNAPSLHLTNFTLEAWIKIEGYASTTRSGAPGPGGGQEGLIPIICKGRAEQDLASVDVNYFLSYRLSDLKLVADFEDKNGLGHSVISAATLPMNIWVHVGASFDVATQTWRLFIGNNPAEAFTLTGGPVTPQNLSDVNACIGSTLNSAGTAKPGSFNGRIDEVRIWNTALTVLDPGELTTTPANLVGRWAFDEGAGALVANAVVNGPSGTLSNKMEWVSGFNVPDSTTDASVRFNGVHDYVTFGAALGLNSTAFTVEGWIYREGPGRTTNSGTGGVVAVPIITKGRADGDAPANKNVNYFLGINSTNQLVADFEESNGANHPVTGVATIPNNVWTHVAVTYEPVTAVWNLYINGLLDRTLDIGANINPVNISIEHAAVGSALNSIGVADGFFDGKIDEVRIWGRALGAAELQPNSVCSAASTTSLLGYWNFNENGNVTAFNSVAGGVNGSLISDNISTIPTHGGPSWACNGFKGIYRSKNTTSTWSTASDWEVYNGSTWSVATKPPTYNDDVNISGGTTVRITGPVFCNNLTVNNGGKLWRNAVTNTYVNVYGHIVCNGTIGNGSNFDGISFSIEGDTCSISGTGTFDCSRIKKSCNGHQKTNLTFNRNANLRFNGTALFNDVSSTFFNIKIAQGVIVNCLGDGSANSSGSVAIDGINGADVGYNAGSLKVSGILNLTGIGSGVPTLYLTNSNANVSWPVSVTIDSTGTINTGIINCNASGAAGHSFTIMSGGRLNVTGEPASYVAPSLTNNNYTLNSGSTIEYSKGGNQTVYTFGSINYSNLFASGSGAKTILAPLGLTDTLKVTGSATLASGGNLTLLSSAAKTARVAFMPATANITGDVTVERYIASGLIHPKSWQLLAVPTMGQTIKAAWQEGATASDISSPSPGSAGNPNGGYGTMLTSNVANAATQPSPGFDVYTASGPSIKTYNYTTDNYDGPVTTQVPIYDKKGYFILVRGDRSVITATAPANATILRTKGILFTPFNMPPSTIVVAEKFESAGNPYASAIDVRNIVKTGGIEEFYYVWDPQLGGTAGLGAFVTLSLSGDGNYYATPQSPTYGAGPVNYIQSGQAFFVHATGSNGTMSFNEGAKAGGSMLVTTPARAPQLQQGLRTDLYGIKSDGSTILADGVLNNFGDNYSNAVDRFDARKTTNTAENLSIRVVGKLLAIERRHTVTEQDTIFLNITGLRAQPYRFDFTALNLNANGLEAFLEDNYLHTRTPLELNGHTIVDFSIENIAGSYAPDRFRIVFAVSQTLPVTFTSVKAYRKGDNINVEWQVENEMNIKDYQIEKSTDGIHFITIDAIFAKLNNGGSASYQTEDHKPVEGYNYYRIRSNGINGKTENSNVVKVQIGNLGQSIAIYPNPISNGVINLQLINQPAGTYGMRLLNSLGQVIISRQEAHGGGSGTVNITSGYNLTHGIYQLEITRPDSGTTIKKIIY